MDTTQANQDPMYLLLREGLVDEFNQRKAAGETCEIKGSDLTHADLRKLQPEGLDMSDCQLHSADLRGLDLRHTQLEGASILGAKISDAFFPAGISAEEINLSLVHGTRMRCR